MAKEIEKRLKVEKLKQIIKDYRGIIHEYRTRIRSIEDELMDEYGVIVPTETDPLCQRGNRRKPK